MIDSITMIIVSIAASATAYSLVNMATTWVTGKINGSALGKQLDLQKATDFLSAGVRDTYEFYTKELKAAAADGKLTADERSSARKRAWEFAVSTAKTEGFDLLKHYGPTLGQFMITRIVASKQF